MARKVNRTVLRSAYFRLTFETIMSRCCSCWVMHVLTFRSLNLVGGALAWVVHVLTF